MTEMYKINVFETNPDDNTKTNVTFDVTDSVSNGTFVITKAITTGSKTDAEICAAAQAAAQSEIDAWVSGQSNIGKRWNPDTNSIETIVE